MALNFVGNPYSYYNNRNKTGPLFNGFIYVGEPDLDPTIGANQKAVTAKQEDGTQVPIAQPIRTNSGGYAVDISGNPVVLLVDGNYSIRVNDKQGGLALEQSDVNDGVPLTAEDLLSNGGTILETENGLASIDTIALLRDFEPVQDGQQINLLGHTLAGIGGGEFYFDESDTTSADNNGTIIVTTGGKRWKRTLIGYMNASWFGVIGGGVADDTAAMQAAVDYMNIQNVHMILDLDVIATNIVSTGYTSISGSATISQDNESGRGFEVKLSSLSSGTYNSVSNVALPSGGVEVTKLSGSFTAQVGDVVQVVDSAILAGTSGVNFAETATVQAVDGTGVWLDCKLRHFSFFTAGTLYVMNNSYVKIEGITLKGTSGAFSGSAVRLSALTIAGAVNPVIDVSVESDINSGVALRGCYKARVNLTTSNLRDDSTVSSFGYGVVAYGCCKASDVTLNATKVRHAFTDGIWDSFDTDSWDKGFSLDSIVRGIGMACSSATWDTHPYSDGVIFDTTKAVEGSSNSLGNKDNAYAYQLRGTNARILSGQSDRDKAIFYNSGATALIDSVDIVEISEAVEKLVSLTFAFTENVSGKDLKLIGRNCKLKGRPFSSGTTNIDYVEFESTEFDNQGTNWDPSVSKEYKFTFRYCVFKDIPSFRIRNGVYTFIGGYRITTDGSTFVSPISLFEGAEVVATGFGAKAESFGTRSLFDTEAAATSATTLSHSSCYLHQFDGSTTVNLINKQGSAATVLDLAALVIVP